MDYTLRPNGDGTVALSRSGGSYNYILVDEATADGYSTYVYRNGSSSADDFYSLPDPALSGTITNVRVCHRHCRENVNASGSSRPLLKIDGTPYAGTNAGSPLTWLTSYTDWGSNPDTGKDWEWADINSLQIGVRLTGGVYDDGKDIWYYNTYCTQVYAVISYTAVQSAVVQAGIGLASGRDTVLSRESADITGLHQAAAGRDWAILRESDKAAGLVAIAGRGIDSIRQTSLWQAGVAAGLRRITTSRTALTAFGQSLTAARITTAVRQAFASLGTLVSDTTRVLCKSVAIAVGLQSSAGRHFSMRRDTLLLQGIVLTIRRGFRKISTDVCGLLVTAWRYSQMMRAVQLCQAAVATAQRFLFCYRHTLLKVALSRLGQCAVMARRSAVSGSRLTVAAARHRSAGRNGFVGVAVPVAIARAISQWQALTLVLRKTLLNLPWRELPHLRLRHRQ